MVLPIMDPYVPDLWSMGTKSPVGVVPRTRPILYEVDLSILAQPDIAPETRGGDQQSDIRRSIAIQFKYLNWCLGQVPDTFNQKLRPQQRFLERLTPIVNQGIESYFRKHNRIFDTNNPPVELRCVGSMASGYAFPDGTLDVILVKSPGYPKELEQKYPRLLEKIFLKHKIGARVSFDSRAPVLQLCEHPSLELLETLWDERRRGEQRPTRAGKHLGVEFPKHGFGVNCEISFSLDIATHSTRLLKCYALCDLRVRDVVTLVKWWARCREIDQPSHGTLCPYGYTLMVIHYLMNVCDPPVLPNFQASPFSTESNYEDGYDVGYYQNMKEILDMRLSGKSNNNTECLQSLVAMFFKYYGSRARDARGGFDWVRDIVSIRAQGGLLRKFDKGWTRAAFRDGVRHRYLVAIEDPFEVDHNVARTVTPDGASHIRNEFRRACNVLTRMQDIPGAGMIWRDDDGLVGSHLLARPGEKHHQDMSARNPIINKPAPGSNYPQVQQPKKAGIAGAWKIVSMMRAPPTSAKKEEEQRQKTLEYAATAAADMKRMMRDMEEVEMARKRGTSPNPTNDGTSAGASHTDTSGSVHEKRETDGDASITNSEKSPKASPVTEPPEKHIDECEVKRREATSVAPTGESGMNYNDSSSIAVPGNHLEERNVTKLDTQGHIYSTGDSEKEPRTGSSIDTSHGHAVEYEPHGLIFDPGRAPMGSSPIHTYHNHSVRHEPAKPETKGSYYGPTKKPEGLKKPEPRGLFKMMDLMHRAALIKKEKEEALFQSKKQKQYATAAEEMKQMMQRAQGAQIAQLPQATPDNIKIRASAGSSENGSEVEYAQEVRLNTTEGHTSVEESKKDAVNYMVAECEHGGDGLTQKELGSIVSGKREPKDHASTEGNVESSVQDISMENEDGGIVGEKHQPSGDVFFEKKTGSIAGDRREPMEEEVEIDSSGIVGEKREPEGGVSIENDEGGIAGEKREPDGNVSIEKVVGDIVGEKREPDGDARIGKPEKTSPLPTIIVKKQTPKQDSHSKYAACAEMMKRMLQSAEGADITNKTRANMNDASSTTKSDSSEGYIEVAIPRTEVDGSIKKTEPNPHSTTLAMNHDEIRCPGVRASASFVEESGGDACHAEAMKSETEGDVSIEKVETTENCYLVATLVMEKQEDQEHDKFDNALSTGKPHDATDAKKHKTNDDASIEHPGKHRAIPAPVVKKQGDLHSTNFTKYAAFAAEEMKRMLRNAEEADAAYKRRTSLKGTEDDSTDKSDKVTDKVEIEQGQNGGDNLRGGSEDDVGSAEIVKHDTECEVKDDTPARGSNDTGHSEGGGEVDSEMDREVDDGEAKSEAKGGVGTDEDFEDAIFDEDYSVIDEQQELAAEERLLTEQPGQVLTLQSLKDLQVFLKAGDDSLRKRDSDVDFDSEFAPSLSPNSLRSEETSSNVELMGALPFEGITIRMESY